jgi:hypothetical protein
VDSVHGPWTTSGCLVHRGLALVAWTTGHRDMAVCSPELASSRSRARGQRGEGGQSVTSLTQAREAAMRPGDGSGARWRRRSSTERGEEERGEVQWRMVGLSLL